jgi:hypothetical protein
MVVEEGMDIGRRVVDVVSEEAEAEIKIK